MRIIDADYVWLAIQALCLALILWGAVLYPLICTWELWRIERRLIIFVAAMRQVRRSELEDRLWAKANKAAHASVLACGVLAVAWLTD